MRILETPEGYARMDYCCNKWVPATYPSTCRRNWALPSRGYKTIQREKGACSCLLPFSVANENDHPRDTCSRGRISPERQPSLRTVMEWRPSRLASSSHAGISYSRFSTFSQIIRIFLSTHIPPARIFLVKTGWPEWKFRARLWRRDFSQQLFR